MGPGMKWAMGLLIISAFFVGIAGFIGNIETNYGLDMGDEFANVSSAFENIYGSDEINQIEEDYKSSEGNWTSGEDSASGEAGWALSWPGHILKTFASVFRTIFSLGSLSESMVATTANTMQLDTSDSGVLIKNILITLVGIALVFIGLRAYTGRDV